MADLLSVPHGLQSNRPFNGRYWTKQSSAYNPRVPSAPTIGRTSALIGGEGVGRRVHERVASQRSRDRGNSAEQWQRWRLRSRLISRWSGLSRSPDLLKLIGVCGCHLPDERVEQ